MNSTHRTFSIYIVTGKTRCAGCLCTSSGWFKHIEPHRTFSNHIITEIARCRALSHEFGVVRPYRTFSVYIVTGETRSAGCLCTSLGWFKHIEPHRTFSNHIITEIARCLEFCHRVSTIPNLLCLHRCRGNSVQGAYALVRGGSSTSNLVCIDSRMLSTAIPSPYQTLRATSRVPRVKAQPIN